MRRFQYRYVLGYTALGESLDPTFGQAFHASMKTYWRLRLEHELDPATALDAAIVIGSRVKLPKPTRDKQKGKTPIGLVRCLIWYLEQYDDSPDSFLWVGDKPALELQFRYALPLKNPDGEDYSVRGYIDCLRNFGGIHTVWDYKTTGPSVSPWYMEKYEIDFQNWIYSAGAYVLTEEDYSQFIIDVVGAGVGTIALARQPISLTPSEISEGINDATYVIRRAEDCAEQEYYPKNPGACTFCDFKGICNKAPEVRENFLRTEFKAEPRQFIEDNR
jgi:hypothetical protein